MTIDCVVMGAYGHSRIRNLIIGSTTTAMVRAAHVPIMVRQATSRPSPARAPVGATILKAPPI